MQVTLVERLAGRDYLVVARGTVDGKAAARFIRSLCTDTISAECEDGWALWRWHVRYVNGRRQVNKAIQYRG